VVVGFFFEQIIRLFYEQQYCVPAREILDCLQHVLEQMGIRKARRLVMVTAKIEEKGRMAKGNTLFGSVGFVGSEEMNWSWVDLRQDTFNSK